MGSYKISIVFLKASLLFQSFYFTLIIYLLIILLIVILGAIFLYVNQKSHQEIKTKKWSPLVYQLIQNAIFNEDDGIQWGTHSSVLKLKKLLKKRAFKNYLIDELIKAKINFTENITLNIKKLYVDLGLQHVSIAKLKSSKWHIKVKGIQELSLMDQQSAAKDIFRLTNHKNQFVRFEAQSALIDFFGFAGLRFLNVAVFKVTEWQQIQLLNKLTHLEPENFGRISQWLHSPNESVVVFALKLISHYKCYELYDDVLPCLYHPSDEVNMHAVKCLQQIYREDTSEALLNHYAHTNKNCQLLILQSLFGYNPERESEFLLQELSNNDNDIKLTAARTLSSCMMDGRELLDNHPLTNTYPWKQIFNQIKSEAAV